MSYTFTGSIPTNAQIEKTETYLKYLPRWDGAACF